MVLSTHKSVISTRINRLYWFQLSPVVLCIQNRDFRSRITSLCGSKTPPVVFACKTAPSGPEKQVSMGPRHDLSFCAWKTARLAQELKDYIGSSTHLWFLHAKQGLLDPNNKSLWVPDLTCPFVQAKHRDLRQNIKSIWVPALSCGFCMQNSDFRTRLTRLYGSQTSSVVLSTHNSVLSTRINRLYWFQLSPVVLCIQNSDFRTRITSVCGSKTPLVVFACKQRLLDQNNKCLWVPEMTCRFVHVQQRA